MPDRLEVLRQQRALVQEQLAWFDREIAALSSSAPEASAPPAAASAAVAPPAVVAPAVPVAPRVVPAAPLPDFPEYQADAASMQSAARRGCLMYAALAFALLFLGAVAIYFLAYRDHPVLFADKPATATSK